MPEQLLKGHFQPSGPGSKNSWSSLELLEVKILERPAQRWEGILAVLGCEVGGGRKEGRREGRLLKVKRGKSRESVGGVGRDLGWKLERSQRFGPGVGKIMGKITWRSP